MLKRILFVDDEPMVLAALRRSLHGMRQQWEMTFVCGGSEALQAMEAGPFDMIVTDMRMPMMDGAQLLEEVKLKFPQCLRFVLSGQADRETLLKTVNPAHQFLAKPCDISELRKHLTRALALRGLLQNEELRGLVSQLESVPALPANYAALNKELSKTEPSLQLVGQIVAEDMALAAKILQLVNSAFFGLPGRLADPCKAIALLGLDIVKALVLSTHVFSSFQTDLLASGDVEYLWRHSIRVASYTRSIAVIERCEQTLVDECFTAGLLHDLGKVILASTMPRKFQEVLCLARDSDNCLVTTEQKILGCNHAEVAAFLLSLWGLPDNVIQGVAWHHEPSQCIQPGFSTVTATHVASLYEEQQNPHWIADRGRLDTAYLARVHCLEKEVGWRDVVHASAEMSLQH